MKRIDLPLRRHRHRRHDLRPAGDSGSTSPNASPRPTARAASAATASSCMSGNCVDGVCCAQSAAAMQRAPARPATSPGSAGTCGNVPAGLTDDTCPSDQACDASQQCKTLLGQRLRDVQRLRQRPLRRRRLLQQRLQRHLQGRATWPRKRGHLLAGPGGNEDPVDSCLRLDRRSAAPVRRHRHLHERPEGERQAVHRGAASARAGSASTASAATAPAPRPATRATRRALRGAARRSRRPASTTAPPRPATARCSTAAGRARARRTRSRTAGVCGGNADCGSGYCVDGVCCNSTCTGTCQSCAVAGQRGVRQPAGRPQDANARRVHRRHVLRRRRHLPVGREAERAAMHRRQPSAARASASTASAASSACTGGLLHLQRLGQRDVHRDLRGRQRLERDRACAAPNFCTALRECTAGKKPNGATCATTRLRLRPLRRQGLLRERLLAGGCHVCTTRPLGTCVLAAG